MCWNRSFVLIVPGPIDTRTGGYEYDRRMLAGLRAHGWDVRVEQLGDSFPEPTDADLTDAARVLRSIPDGTPVVIDGLAFGAMPAIAECERSRLRLVALVHHPLAAETGIPSDVAIRLYDSERRALANACRVVVTSRATITALEKYDVGVDRIAVAEPGTDRAPLARGSAEGRAELLCVATVVPRKRHEVLVRALACLANRPWHLTCVGSLDRHPPTVDRLRAQVRDAGLDGRVSLVGDMDPPNVAGYYDRADLFVLPTEYEGYGMVVAEALARGLPVISTPTGAITELVGESAGVLVPPNDSTALTGALDRVLSDPGLRARLAEGARQVREGLSDWVSASRRLSEVLDGVVTGNVRR